MTIILVLLKRSLGVTVGRNGRIKAIRIYETFIISVRDSSHKYTKQGVNCRTFYANVR